MSAPPIPPQTTAKAPHPKRTRAVVTVTLLLLAALIGPFVAMEVPREVGRWQLAAALNRRAKGDKDAAYQQLNSAMSWFTSSPELLLQRAEWRLEDGQRDAALADCDEMVELSKDSFQSLMAHSLFLQNAGEFARAVDDWKKIEQFSQRSGIPHRATALNGLAYAQALAKVDLELALKHVNEALQFAPQNASILDTRGYILHLLGRNDEALADLDRAVKRPNDQPEPTEEKTPAAPKRSLPIDTINSSRPKTLLELTNTPQARVDAVMHYHRALILHALDRHTEADAERALVRKLIGRDGDDTLF
jgi:tetratricopeptide (TPR) repeat protein